MKVGRTFTGKVINGRIVLNDPHSWQRLINSLDGHDIEVGMARRRKVRSLNANSFYWAVVIELIAAHCGMLPEETHDALRMKFLTDHTGEIPRVRSTATLDTKEFGEYVDHCIQLGAELGVVIPNPMFHGEMA